MATRLRQPPVLPNLEIDRHSPTEMWTIWLAVLLGYLLLAPPQLNVAIGGSVLPPYRLFLLPATIFVVQRAVRGQMRIEWPDLAMVGATFWIALSLFITTEASEAITSAIAQICDIGLAYFFGRAVIRTPRDLRVFLILMAPGLFAMGAIIAVESLTKTHIYQPLFSAIAGAPSIQETPVRLGLMRAKGSFPHSILAGIFLASFLPLYALSGLRGWPPILGCVAAICSFFTISSAALIGLAAGLGLVIYNWLSERYQQVRWRIFLMVSGLIFFALEFGTQSGAFSLIMRYASLSPHNAYYRLLIWRFGSENVEKNPWFGIGYADWDRPAWMAKSIDHYWLLLAIQFGVIPPLLIALATIIALVTLSRSSVKLRLADRRLVRAVLIALGVFAIGIVSVSIWLSAQVWFFMLLGITVSLGQFAKPIAASFVPTPSVFHGRDDRPPLPTPNAALRQE